MRKIDCRTCQNLARSDCLSTAQCVDGDQYKPSSQRQYWKRSLMDLAGMLHTGAHAVPVGEMSISDRRQKRLSDGQIVELGKHPKSKTPPWGIGTVRDDYLRGARAIETACATAWGVTLEDDT